MRVVRVHTASLYGIGTRTVTVEVGLSQGGVGLSLVGLADNAVKESEQRIRAAFEHTGRRVSGRKIVVSLAPANERKEGSHFDLPIGVGILAVMGEIGTEQLEESMICGELSLDGSVRGVPGVLSLALAARRQGLRRMILPAENAAEAAVVEGLEVIGVTSLGETIELLNGERTIEPARPQPTPEEPDGEGLEAEDFADVKGQPLVKRALEIAAAGGHNILMIGAPGSGKTMLARRLPTILPPLTTEESLETTCIHSVAGLCSGAGLLRQRPFRAPHHTSSQVSLIGGGRVPTPGEVSLAHNGVLFLDELPEFGKSVLEVLRQPLEDGEITVARANYRVSYPAKVTLVAAMNPCPCGYYNHPQRGCTCTPAAVQRYLNHLSGPLLDRIDLHVEVLPVDPAVLQQAPAGESSATIRRRVLRAREIQRARFAGIEGVHTNAGMNAQQLERFCGLDSASEALLRRAMERLSLSARAYTRIRKVARTIADLAGHETIELPDVAEAVGYRRLDRENWGSY